MSKKILTYVLSFWYLVLFQIYPVVHIHWHSEHGLETCFHSVEHGHDADVRPSHVEYHGDDQCRHDHFKADFDHFFSTQSDSDKKHHSVDFLTPDIKTPPGPQASQANVALNYGHPLEFYHTTLSNKSPPTC